MTITKGLLEEIDAAMVQAMTAIDDWLSIHASDMCDDARVEESRKRVNEHGTLWYIACVQKVNSDALAKLRDARSSDPAHAMSADAMREAAAALIDQHSVGNSSVSGKYLAPRRDGDIEGMFYAAAIRALPLTAPKEG